MIKHISYRIITVLMLIVFVAASTGLSVYIHNCACEQRIIASLFVEHKCHEEQITSCCSVPEEKETNHSTTDACCGCKSEHFSIKLNELFNGSNPITITQKVELAAAYQFKYQESTLKQAQGFNTNTKLYIPDDSPPIKPVGRILVYLLHQSKTPALLS